MIRHQYRLRSRTGIKALPNELLLKVQGLLPLRDLKNAVLVDKKWNRVGEDPGLWSQAVVRVRSGEDIVKLSIGRFARLREIDITPDANWGNADWELVFQNIEKLQVKEIWGLHYRDMRGVDPGLLARALYRVEVVNLLRCQLTPQQITSIFNHIAMRDTNIKKLGLGGQDLSVVPTDDLSIAVSRVENVYLISTRLTTGQLTSMLRPIVDEETKVKWLWLWLDGNDLSAVEGNLLNRAENKLAQSGGRIRY